MTWLAPYVLSHRVSAEETAPREIVDVGGARGALG